jgi:hypothetical protein
MLVDLDLYIEIAMLTVYVKLLNEGTVVFRPAQAEPIGQNAVRLLTVADYDRRDEEWEFPPGSVVRCESRVLAGEKTLVAVELYNRQRQS